MKKNAIIIALSFLLCSYATKDEGLIKSSAAEWENLLDEDLSKWDKFIGVPHYTVDINHPKGDGKEGTPLGLNNDPLGVYTMIKEGSDDVLAISGQIYAGLSTKKEYQNYHLSMEFKWGEKKYEPRLDVNRDSGVLYHCQEPQGQFWNVWMKGAEMQVLETGCGDFFPLAGVSMDVMATERQEGDRSYWFYDPNGTLTTFKSNEKYRCRRNYNHENPHGKWNRLEVVCLGDTSYHIVNGHVVMALTNGKYYDENQNSYPLSKGKIQIQSEGAEAYYKNIRIRAVNSLPAEFSSQL